jgi:hypothetical protein
MSDLTKNDLIRRNIFLSQELKNLKIENEKLRKRGVWKRIIELFEKIEQLKNKKKI